MPAIGGIEALSLSVVCVAILLMEKTFQNSNVSARSSARLGDRASVLFLGQTSPT